MLRAYGFHGRRRQAGDEGVDPSRSTEARRNGGQVRTQLSAAEGAEAAGAVASHARRSAVLEARYAGEQFLAGVGITLHRGCSRRRGFGCSSARSGRFQISKNIVGVALAEPKIGHRHVVILM